MGQYLEGSMTHMYIWYKTTSVSTLPVNAFQSANIVQQFVVFQKRPDHGRTPCCETIHGDRIPAPVDFFSSIMITFPDTHSNSTAPNPQHRYLCCVGASLHGVRFPRPMRGSRIRYDSGCYGCEVISLHSCLPLPQL